jgi:hypothetical protein
VSLIDQLQPVFVEAFPAQLDSGVLYISTTFRTTGHLCCCGCGEEVIAPLAPSQWSVTFDGQSVTLHPSIGNWSLPCQSHYWISNNTVRWSRQFSPEEIKRTRHSDREAIAADNAGIPRRTWWSRLFKRPHD